MGVSKNTKQILDWLENGVEIEWVPVHAESQQEHPRYSQRVGLVSLVKELSAQAIGREQVELAMEGLSLRERGKSDTGFITCLCTLIYRKSTHVCIIYAHVYKSRMGVFLSRGESSYNGLKLFSST